MTLPFFETQTRRLITRFSNKAFDQEFLQLVWREVCDMSEAGFGRYVDVLIGSRTHLKPPLLSEFREARLNEQKLKLQNDIRGAGQFLERKAPAAMKEHVRKVLSSEFGAVNSVKDAFEVARLKLLKKRDDDGGAA